MTDALTEAELLSRTLLLSRGDLRLLRNNVGEAWQGPSTRYDKPATVHLKAGDVVVRFARRVKYGVGNPGGGDLLGWKRQRITAQHVGQHLAQFASLELKSEDGTASLEQLQWAAAVAQMGGISGIAYNEADVRRILGLS